LGVRSRGVRDAGNYGWDLTFAEAVTKARKENYSDYEIVGILAWRKPEPTLQDVQNIPKPVEVIKLEDLAFRIDGNDGGMILEYKVDGRAKTQTVPKMVGQVLEVLVKEVKELKGERHTSTSGGDGKRGVRDGSGPGKRPGPGSKPGPGKGKKAKADAKA